MSRTAVAIFLTLVSFGLSAASPLQMGEQKIEWTCLVSYRFGETLTLKGNIPLTEFPEEIHLVFRVGSQTSVHPLKIDAQGNFEAHYRMQEVLLRPFAHVQFWVEGRSQKGESFITTQKDFFYEDNRFPWKTRLQEPFRVHWRQGDLQFAQMALNVAKQSQSALLNWLPLAEVPTVEIYIYDTVGELRQALQLTNSSWVGAHADPDLGVILIAVNEGLDQRLQMEQQIPHELMHIYLFHYEPSAYSNLPYWLNEGLATAIELYPNPDYYSLLETAHQKDSFLTLKSLCDTFPQDASSVYLAYAQSGAIVQFLIERYGMEKLRQLITAYANQVNCETGFYRNYGFSTAQLEQEWRQARFGETSSKQALANLAPWGVIFVLVLFVPVVLSIRLIYHTTKRKESG